MELAQAREIRSGRKEAFTIGAAAPNLGRQDASQLGLESILVHIAKTTHHFDSYLSMLSSLGSITPIPKDSRSDDLQRFSWAGSRSQFQLRLRLRLRDTGPAASCSTRSPLTSPRMGRFKDTFSANQVLLGRQPGLAKSLDDADLL